MSKFYFFLWLRWSLRVTLCSTLLASALALAITSYIYINQSMPALNSEVFEALLNIFKFWFPIVWSLTLLLALFRSLKYIFNICFAGYELKLYSCDGKYILEDIGYGDLVKVWRKWFMLIIWLVGSLMVLSLAYFGKVENVDSALKDMVVEFIIRYRFEKSFITLENYYDMIGTFELNE